MDRVPLQEAQPPLVAAEMPVVDAAQELLNGRATKGDRRALRERSIEHGEVLKSQCHEIIAAYMDGDTQDETAAKREVVALLCGSLQGVVSNAAYLHYDGSLVERLRFFSSSTPLRLKLGAIASTAAISYAGDSAVRYVENFIPIDRITPANILGFTAAAITTRLLLRKGAHKALKLPGDHFRRSVRRGITRDKSVIKEVHRIMKKEALLGKSARETSIKRSYQIITELAYIEQVESALWTVAGPISPQAPQREKFVDATVDEAIDWLLAYYGVAAKDKTKPIAA